MANGSDRELLEVIAKKLADSKALNGGFDKLCLMIEHIQEKQNETGVKLDKVSEALYDPDNGLFSRVKDIEQKIDGNMNEIEKKIEIVPDVKTDIHDLKKFQKTIEEICGNQLNELSELVKLRKNLSTIYWGFAATIILGIAKLLFDLSKHQ